MATLRAIFRNESWTQEQIGQTSSTMIQVATAHGFALEDMQWNGPTQVIFKVNKSDCTYLEYAAFRSDFEQVLATLEVDVKLVTFDNQ